MGFSELHRMIRQRRSRKAIYSQPVYWDSKAGAYQDTAVSMWPNRSLNRLYETEQKRLISLRLGPIEGLALLDLGCGTGRFSRWFAAQGARVTGVDFSAQSLAIAQRLSPGGNPAFRHVSVFDLTDEKCYDVAFVWGVLTVACIDRNQLLDALGRVHRALRPTGRLLLTEPIHRGFLHRVLELDLSEFLAVMGEAGFTTQAISPLHFWPMRLGLCYFSWPGWVTSPLYHLGQLAMKLPGLSQFGDYWSILATPTAAKP